MGLFAVWKNLIKTVGGSGTTPASVIGDAAIAVNDNAIVLANTIDAVDANTTNIAANAANIATNTADISTNTSGINTVSTNLSAHEAATSAHGVAGAIVGTTDTQTLTNKTLTSPTITGTASIPEVSFPAPSSPSVGANAVWLSGTPNQTVGDFMLSYKAGDNGASALGQTDSEFDHIVSYGWNIDSAGNTSDPTRDSFVLAFEKNWWFNEFGIAENRFEINLEWNLTAPISTADGMQSQLRPIQMVMGKTTHMASIFLRYDQVRLNTTNGYPQWVMIPQKWDVYDSAGNPMCLWSSTTPQHLVLGVGQSVSNGAYGGATDGVLSIKLANAYNDAFELLDGHATLSTFGTTRLDVDGNGNVSLNGIAPSGAGVICIQNASVNPGVYPVNGGYLYVTGGNLAYLGPTGSTVYPTQPFVASGGSHRMGLVPDPGSTAGTTHFLREDATWVVIPITANASTGNAGSITLNGGGSSSNSGTINLSGGSGTACSGGSINTQGGAGSAAIGGSINTYGSGNAAGGSISTNANLSTYTAGGSINTSGGSSAAGGSITTTNGGGSIDTTGNGSIQFGTSANRITLIGTAGANGKTITLPATTGTLLTDHSATLAAGVNLQVPGGGNVNVNGGDSAGGAGVISINVAATAPTTDPIAGFTLFVDPADSKLKARGSSGTITTLALP